MKFLPYEDVPLFIGVDSGSGSSSGSSGKTFELLVNGTTYEFSESGANHNDKPVYTDSGNNYYIAFYGNSGGNSVVGSINSEVAYTTFTGQHPTQIADDVLPLTGSILQSTGNVLYKNGLANAWVETRCTTSEKQKAAVGVFNGAWSNKTEIEGMVYVYNALGEGQILVTDENGNIEVGDYICSSNRPGHGMLQDDDILHNYTVAKATEAVNFDSIASNDILGYKSVLIACTYHCG